MNRAERDVYTENDLYKLMYTKGYQKTAEGKQTWIKPIWRVVDNSGEIVWRLDGRLVNKHQVELGRKFKLKVKL